MNLEKRAKAVGQIKETMAGCVGERLGIRANMGRSKIMESTGKLIQVHPQLFVMELERKRGRTARQSYQYVDILTGMVQVFRDGEPIFGTFDFDQEEADEYEQALAELEDASSLDYDGEDGEEPLGDSEEAVTLG